MKQYKNIIILSILVIVLSSCSKVLDKTPVDRYSNATIWTDISLVDAYLNTAYRNLSHGFIDNATLGSVSDETFCVHLQGTDVYTSGDITANNPGFFSSARSVRLDWTLFNNVQIINTFLENIDKVAESYPQTEQPAIKARTEILKGEALFLRAYSYAQMARTYGGLPLMTKSWKVGDDYLSVPRGTFKETIDFIVADINAAVPLLKSKSQTEPGRATDAAALVLKSRILLFAASDLTADGTAESKYVGYESPDRTALWTTAKNAARQVMDLGTYQLADFGAPDKNAVATNYFNFFKQTDLSNNEIIWGKMFVTDIGDRQSWNLQQSPNGFNGFSSDEPTQDMVDQYQMEDGSDFFDHFTVDANGNYKNKGTTKYKNENPYYNREPRFYGSILYDSAIWQKRPESLVAQDELGIFSWRTRVVVENGNVVSTTYGLDTRNGPIGANNAGLTGYLTKKMMDDNVFAKEGAGVYNNNIWIVFRYAEILLNYAEACIELGGGDLQNGIDALNMIRNRSGLPDRVTSNQAVARDSLRHERQIELAFEEHRWYDIRRWKILENVLTDAKGILILETKNLDNGTTTTTWQLNHVQDRNALKKMYWIPIPQAEIEKAPQIPQNPGY